MTEPVYDYRQLITQKPYLLKRTFKNFIIHSVRTYHKNYSMAKLRMDFLSLQKITRCPQDRQT